MTSMKRLRVLGVVIAVGASTIVSGAFVRDAIADTKTKDVPLKANPALKAKIDARFAPFTFGISSEQAFKQIEKTIDAEYAPRIEKLGDNYKAVERLENDRDKKKKELRGKLVTFSGTGVSGYEMKGPGEFTYKNQETAIEVTRPGGGTRQLFFINDHLWKVYDQVVLSGKDAELGDTWDSAVAKLTAALDGDKGKDVAKKTPSPSYYGTLIDIPAHHLWSDGTTQVRLVDHTHREDMPDKTVGIAYEEIATVEKLPSLRTKVEAKSSDAQVDAVGGVTGAPSTPPKKK